MSRKYGWERISDEMQTFVARAAELNQQIADSALLGSDFEIGHTYFFKITGLLERAERLQRKNRAGHVLWSKRGDPLSPVLDLWSLSLEPLIEQHLQGIDAPSRKDELRRLRLAFLGPETAPILACNDFTSMAGSCAAPLPSGPNT